MADPDIIIAGIGSSIPFANVDHTRYDTIHWVGFTAALAGSIDLLREHAVFAGLSTGAAYLAAHWEHHHEQRHRPNHTTVFIAADTGHRYVDAVFARHHDTPPIGSLTPTHVSTVDELVLPWLRMDWDRATAPDP